MKRILFVVVCLISFSAKADTKRYCSVVHNGSNTAFFEEIQKKCKKDDALNLSFMRLDFNFLENIDFLIANVCRMDREIHYFFYDEEKTTGRMVCVYSGKREWR